MGAGTPRTWQWFERRRDADGKVSHSGRIQWSDIIRYALIILLQFWLQPVPYADLNGDNHVNFGDYGALSRLMEGQIWVAKFTWFCQNVYEDGQTELVEGWTYTIWENKPAKKDRRPDIPGFVWVDPRGGRPIVSMNYVFFEHMFPELIVRDPNQPVYVETFPETGSPPTIRQWEIASDHGLGVGELWSPIEDGYIEPRAGGISKLCVWFDQPMDTNTTNPDVISISSLDGTVQLHPFSITWDDNDCMIVELSPALPDQTDYEITVSVEVESATGYALFGDRDICITALRGDVNASREVNSQDLLAVKTHVGETVGPGNARFDVNRSGQLNAQDLLAVYANIGHSPLQ